MADPTDEFEKLFNDIENYEELLFLSQFAEGKTPMIRVELVKILIKEFLKDKVVVRRDDLDFLIKNCVVDNITKEINNFLRITELYAKE